MGKVNDLVVYPVTVPLLVDRLNFIKDGGPEVYRQATLTALKTLLTETYETRTALGTATVDADVDIVRTGGYATAGDGGGALYKRVGAEPSHALKVSSNGGTVWWELVHGILDARQAGVKADGSTDDFTAHQAALDKLDADGGGAYLLPIGTSMVSQKLVIGSDIKIIGHGTMNSIIKASATMTAVLEFGSGGASFLNMEGFQIDGDSKADDCFLQTAGISQGSSIAHIRFINSIEKGWHCQDFIYAMDMPGLIFSGGKHGFYGKGNTPFNGASFYNVRVSNTTEWAMYFENTGASEGKISLYNPIIEGNDGGGLLFKQVGGLIDQPWFELNGKVTDKPHFTMVNPGVVVHRLEVNQPIFSTDGAAQTVHMEIEDTHCRLRITGGNLKDSHILDVNSQVSAVRVELIRAATNVTVRSFFAVIRDSEVLDKEVGAVFGTNATGMDIAAWGRGVIEVLTMVRTGDAMTVGKYLIPLRNFPAPRIYWIPSCALATTANITLSGEQTIDGTLTSATRILVKNQSAPEENGIYVTDASAWTRATDADTAAEVTGLATEVTGGSANSGKSYYVSSTVTTLDTDAVTVVELTATASAASIGGTDNVTFSVVDGEVHIKRGAGSEGRYLVTGMFTQMEYQTR